MSTIGPSQPRAARARSSAWALAALMTAGASADVLASPSSAGEDLAGAMPTTAPWWQPRVGRDVPPPSHQNFHTPGVIFINFDGAQMQSCNGSDAAVADCSTIMNDMVLPYSGGASARAAVVQAMASDVSDFALEVVDARPPDEVKYDMVMVGNWEPPPEEGGFAGVAPTIDCFNYTLGETSFSLDLGSPTVVAKVVGQEVAHVWGLEHVDSSGDLLFPTTGGMADPRFEDTCSQIVVLDGGIQPTQAVCPEMHALNCPDQPDHQNSYQDLMMMFGPPRPDLVSPALEIVAPAEGEAFPSGTDVDLVLRMSDNISPPLFDVFVALDMPDMGPQVGAGAFPGPDLTVPIQGLPDGEHALRVDITDTDGNPATAMVTFSIGEAAAETGGADAGDAGSGPGGTGGGDDGGSDGDAGADGGSSSDDGCGCRSPSNAAPPWWALVMFAVRRRRR